MKSVLRRLFSPLLNLLESGDGPYAYKPSHRRILIFMSLMFIGLATLALVLLPPGEYGYLLPVVVFGGGGTLGVVVGILGSDRAVAKIWGGVR